MRRLLLKLLAAAGRPSPPRPTLYDSAVDDDVTGPRPLRCPSPGSRHVRLIPAEEATRARLRPARHDEP